MSNDNITVYSVSPYLLLYKNIKMHMAIL